MKTKQIIQKIIDYGLLSTLIIFPLSINIALISPKDLSHPLITINFSLADLLIGAILILWAFKVYIYKEYKLIKLPPTPILIFIGIGMLSFVNAFSISQWVKEIIQMIEYFVLFFILLINNLKTTRLSVLKNAIFISSSIILVVAFIQQTILKGDPYLIRGLFENRNILGTYLCMTIPFIYVELIHSAKITRKIWMLILILLSFMILTSGSAILSLVISLFIINWLYSKKLFLKFSISIVSLGILYSFVMPQKNVTVIKEFASIYEQGSISENYYRRITILTDVSKNIIFQKKINENLLWITTAELLDVKLPDFKKGEQYKDMEDTKHIKNRYLEMQASLNLLSENTMLGVGLGNFQNHIGTFYKELPKVNTSEPNQHNGYLLVGSTMGIFGLTSLIWIFFSLIKKNHSNFKIAMYENKGLYLSLCGSLIACAIENFFSVLFTSALMVPFVVLLFLSYSKFELKN